MTESLLAKLIEHGYFIPTGVPGLYGKSGAFESILSGFDALVTRVAQADRAEVMRFPPVLSREVFEKSGFLKSFPQLAGSVWSFEGNGQDHAALLEAVAHGDSWGQYQKMTDTVLAPAACYSVYPLFRGRLPQAGRLVDLHAWCFRHEPSNDPARLQSFRMREMVRVASPDEVVTWRDTWLSRGLELLTGLGLPVRSSVANDPFFGRGGKMLALNQREQQLKFEILCPVTSEAEPTAITSFNWHQDHFTKTFGIETASGDVANTACLGFGLERVTLALLSTHGMDLSKWPAAVRSALWP